MINAPPFAATYGLLGGWGTRKMRREGGGGEGGDLAAATTTLDIACRCALIVV